MADKSLSPLSLPLRQVVKQFLWIQQSKGVESNRESLTMDSFTHFNAFSHNQTRIGNKISLLLVLNFSQSGTDLFIYQQIIQFERKCWGLSFDLNGFGMINWMIWNWQLYMIFNFTVNRDLCTNIVIYREMLKLGREILLPTTISTSVKLWVFELEMERDLLSRCCWKTQTPPVPIPTNPDPWLKPWSWNSFVCRATSATVFVQVVETAEWSWVFNCQDSQHLHIIP